MEGSEAKSSDSTRDENLYSQLLSIEGHHNVMRSKVWMVLYKGENALEVVITIVILCIHRYYVSHIWYYQDDRVNLVFRYYRELSLSKSCPSANMLSDINKKILELERISSQTNFDGFFRVSFQKINKLISGSADHLPEFDKVLTQRNVNNFS